MLRFAGLAMILLAVAAPTKGLAQNARSTEIRACAGVEDDTARLACFDKLATADGVDLPATGRWQIEEDADPLTDARRVFAILNADDGLSRLGRPISLVIRCNGGRIDVYVNWQYYLGSDGPQVTSRIGEAEAQRTRWSISTDHTSSFFPGNPPHLLWELRNASRWVLQVTPYSESPVTAIFTLTGIEDVIQAMSPTCTI